MVLSECVNRRRALRRVGGVVGVESAVCYGGQCPQARWLAEPAGRRPVLNVAIINRAVPGACGNKPCGAGNLQAGSVQQPYSMRCRAVTLAGACAVRGNPTVVRAVWNPQVSGGVNVGNRTTNSQPRT